jgi:hypothetical protein
VQAAFQAAAGFWPFAPMCRCSGRGADTRVCSADTPVGAAVLDMLLQIVQSSAARPAGGYFSGFV